MIRACLCFLPLALAACASTSDYPSLARRDAERISGTADVVAPAQPPAPAAPPPSPELTSRLAQLVEQASAAHQRFAARRPAAERLIAAASGAAVASESWSVASIALADLEATRSDAMIALGELDELYAAASVGATEGGSVSAADAAAAAHGQVDAWVAEDEAVLARLRGRLPG